MYYIMAGIDVYNNLVTWVSGTKDFDGYSAPMGVDEISVLAAYFDGYGSCCNLAETLATGDSADGQPINQLLNLQFVASDENGNPVTEGFSFTKVLRWSTSSDTPVLVPIISHTDMVELLGGFPPNQTAFQVAVYLHVTRTQPTGSTVGSIEVANAASAFRVKSDGIDLFFELQPDLVGYASGLLLTQVNIDATTNDDVSLVATPNGAFPYLWAAEIRLVSTAYGSWV